MILAPCLSAQKQDGSITRKVDVVVRTVTAVITDEKGQPLATDPLPGDFELLEDGQRCEVVGVDRVGGAESATAKEAKDRPVSNGGVASNLTRSGKGRRQVLYVDAGFERIASVKEVAQAFGRQVESLVALGTVEIVVADPETRLFFPASRSAEALRMALDGLSRNVRGRDRVLAIRRDAQESQNADLSRRAFRGSRSTTLAPVTGSASGRGAIFEEVAVIRSGLRRLSRWATSSPVPTEGILYLASDGFDTDLTAFYTNVSGDPVRNEVLTPLLSEIRRTEQALLAGGWTTVPVAVGASVGSGFTSAAEFEGRGRALGIAPSDPSLTFADHPLDPLRSFAEATGGELLVSGDQLKGAVSRFANAFAVSFQVSRVPDGRLHRLVLRSLRKGLVVKSVRAIPVGTVETASTSRVLDVLESGPAGGKLPVSLSLSAPEERGKGRIGGRLEVRVLVRDILPLLARLGEGRMRVSVAVEIPGEIPFVTHDERVLQKDLKDGWLLELPMVWPKGARKIAVVAEELASGSVGSATLDLAPR